MAKNEIAYLMNNWQISEGEAHKVLAAIKRQQPILVAGKANNAKANRGKVARATKEV